MALLLYPEAADLLRISESTLRRLVKKGLIAPVWFNRCVRFERAAIDALVQNGKKLQTRKRRERLPLDHAAADLAFSDGRQNEGNGGKRNESAPVPLG